jgi:regulator of cell morphogenesis and NO signaling
LLCRGLLALLATHNMKEERILYPQVDELLAAGERDDLVDLIATAQIPPGWICQRAGKAGHFVR